MILRVHRQFLLQPLRPNRERNFRILNGSVLIGGAQGIHFWLPRPPLYIGNHWRHESRAHLSNPRPAMMSWSKRQKRWRMCVNGTTVALSLLLLHVTHACIWVAWVVSMAVEPEIAADVSIFCYYDYNESNLLWLHGYFSSS